ncbi:alpha/beta hydrolase [Streptomyces sp. NPDC051954]|uniref:alpha/beta hydrolase n=1 Tax=unclassified Streptomyces TaxID=2593676 RepID=UPI003417A684
MAGVPGQTTALPRTNPAAAATADCDSPPPFSAGIFATSVATGDNRTSRVIRPEATDPQMQCGARDLTLRTDITYATVEGAGGQPRELKLDIQTPTTGGRHPLVVYVPGGGFIRADKTSFLGKRTHIAEQGYVVASIEYRTTLDEATYVDGVADVKAAIRFLRAHAAEFGIDPRNVAAYGESAGGYLASMVGTTGGVQTFDQGGNLDQSSRVQAVVNWFGPSDLSRIASDLDPATRASYENSVDNALVKYVLGPDNPTRLLDVPDAVAAANPVTYIDRRDPPFIHFHGTRDGVISPSQTLLLHNALRAKGVTSTRFVLKNAGHGNLVPDGVTTAPMWTTSQVMGLVTGFLGRRVGMARPEPSSPWSA